MKEFKCYIVDDEPLAINVIEQHLSKLDQFEICGTTTDPIEAFSALKSLQLDLLFLDIEMPDLTGLELIESLESKPEVIITTAYREYAVEGFEHNVLDYLVKPIPFTRFLKSINKVSQKFLNERHPDSGDASNEKSFIFLMHDKKSEWSFSAIN